MRAALSNVADFGDEMFRKLSLNGQIPLVHRGILDVWIEGANRRSLRAGLSDRRERRRGSNRGSRHGDGKTRGDSRRGVADQSWGNNAAVGYRCRSRGWDVYKAIEQEPWHLASHGGYLECGKSVKEPGVAGTQRCFVVRRPGDRHTRAYCTDVVILKPAIRFHIGYRALRTIGKDVGDEGLLGVVRRGVILPA